MIWRDLLAWSAGIGSLLYFLAALVNPIWFLGAAEEQPDHADEAEATELISQRLGKLQGIA